MSKEKNHKMNVDSLFPSNQKSGERNKKMDVETIFINTPLNEKPKVSTFSSDMLIDRLKRKEQRKLNFYSDMLAFCHEKIDFADNNGETDLLFTVPLSMSVCKEYEPIECLTFVSDNLRKDDFDTSLYPDSFCLFITWKNIEQKKKEKEKEKEK